MSHTITHHHVVDSVELLLFVDKNRDGLAAHRFHGGGGGSRPAANNTVGAIGIVSVITTSAPASASITNIHRGSDWWA